MVRFINKKTISSPISKNCNFLDDIKNEKITTLTTVRDLDSPPPPSSLKYQKLRKRYDKKKAEEVSQDISRSFSSSSITDEPSTVAEFLKQLESPKPNEKKTVYGRRQSYSQETANKINLIYGLKTRKITNENKCQQSALTKFAATRKISKTFNPKTFNRMPTIIEENFDGLENDR